MGVAAGDPDLAAEGSHGRAGDHSLDDVRPEGQERAALAAEALQDDVRHALVVAVVNPRLGSRRRQGRKTSGVGAVRRTRLGHRSDCRRSRTTLRRRRAVQATPQRRRGTPAVRAGRAEGTDEVVVPVGVVIATRNRVEELLGTLEKLVALPESPDVVVVDNASDDTTARSVRARFGGTGLLVLPQNAGAAARNAGARHLRCGVVAFCDDDSWWEPGALGAAAALFDAHPGLALVAGKVVVEPSGTTDPTCERMARSPIASGVVGPDGACPGVLGFLACGAVVRKEAFLGVGGFRMEFGVGGEEALVAIDLSARGWDCVYASHVVAHHRPSDRRAPRVRRRLEARNALWTTWSRRPLAPALGASARVAARALGSLSGARGVVDAALGLGWPLAQRAVVPPRLEASVRAVERQA